MGYSKLGRNSSARKALFRSVLVSLFKHERIETTEAKAKEISGLAEKLITLAKRDDLSARRQVIAELVDFANDFAKRRRLLRGQRGSTGWSDPVANLPS